MKKSLHLAALVFGAVIAIAPAAMANPVYTYTGVDFNQVGSMPIGPSGTTAGTSPYVTSDSVTGTFVLVNSLGVNLANQDEAVSTFSFTDGDGTLTNLNGASASFDLTTNAAGQITAWSITLSTYNPNTDVEHILALENSSQQADYAQQFVCSAGSYVDGSCNVIGESYGYSPAAGTITTGASVPEPASLVLLAGAVFAVGMIRRQRRITAP